jgi:hypothetical protein
MAWRNGISIVHARLVDIADNWISDAAGADPQSGVDCEPNGNEPAGITGDIRITDNRFVNCGIGVSVTPTSGVYGVAVLGNDMGGCRVGLLNSMAGLVWGNNHVHDMRPAGAPIYCHGAGTLVGP